MDEKQLERVATILRSMPVDERSALIEEACESAIENMEYEEATRIRACIKRICDVKMDYSDRVAKIKGLSERGVKEIMLMMFLGGFLDESDHNGPRLPLE